MANKANKQPMHKNCGRPIDVLLVEDNLADVRLTEEAFEDAKVRVEMHVVVDGEQAMDFLHRKGKYQSAARPDVVFLDLGLPKKSGREVLAEIKADKRLKCIPVIILTSSQAEQDILESYGLNANCYVTKPMNPDEFVAVMKAINDFWLTIVKLPPDE